MTLFFSASCWAQDLPQLEPALQKLIGVVGIEIGHADAQALDVSATVITVNDPAALTQVTAALAQALHEAKKEPGAQVLATAVVSDEATLNQSADLQRIASEATAGSFPVKIEEARMPPGFQKRMSPAISWGRKNAYRLTFSLARGGLNGATTIWSLMVSDQIPFWAALPVGLSVFCMSGGLMWENEAVQDFFTKAGAGFSGQAGRWYVLELVFTGVYVGMMHLTGAALPLGMGAAALSISVTATEAFAGQAGWDLAIANRTKEARNLLLGKDPWGARYLEVEAKRDLVAKELAYLQLKPETRSALNQIRIKSDLAVMVVSMFSAGVAVPLRLKEVLRRRANHEDEDQHHFTAGDYVFAVMAVTGWSYFGYRLLQSKKQKSTFCTRVLE